VGSVEITKSFNGRRRWHLHVRREKVHVRYLICWWVLGVI